MANKAGGFITLHRQILDWEWCKNPSTFVLFVHLLLSANFVDGKFEGKTIRRGQLVTSLPSLASTTGLTIQQIRTALKNLISTGEITDVSTNRYRIITISKYNDYQESTDRLTGKQQTINRQLTDNQQATNRQLTGNQQQYNNITREQGNNGTMEQGERKSAPRFSPPTKDQIFDFCMENGLNLDVDRFYDYYSMQGWKLSNGNMMRDWQAAIRQWLARDRKQQQQRQAPVKKVVAQNYEQRDYSDEDNEAMRRMLEMGGML